MSNISVTATKSRWWLDHSIVNIKTVWELLRPRGIIPRVLLEAEPGHGQYSLQNSTIERAWLSLCMEISFEYIVLITPCIIMHVHTYPSQGTDEAACKY